MVKRKKRSIPVWFQITAIIIIVISIPVILVLYQSGKSGLSFSEVLSSLSKKGTEKVETSDYAGDFVEFPQFLFPRSLGNPIQGNPLIANVSVTDINKDGLDDIIVADITINCISIIIQNTPGQFQEITVASEIMAPSHVQAYDFDKDGDLDILVSVLGMLFPNNDRIGSVVYLENEGDLKFTRHVLIENIARVSDVRAGDLDHDGDNDLVVAQFGYDDGETRWMENLGNLKFKSHILQSLSGGINCEIHDFNNDGNPDIALIVSQEWEEIYIFVNDGSGNFKPKLIWGSTNSDYGSSSMNLTDLDLDGDMDILFTNGDAFDYLPPRPRPWHGIQWLENKGGMNFEFHRLTDFGGATYAIATDIDHDNDQDIFAISAYNMWEKADAQSFIWLENRGGMKYVKHRISNNPTHLLTLDAGDFNGDGEIDFVSGGMHTYPPFDRMGRITLWTNTWKELKRTK
jgi:hypothetical protein